MKSTHHKSPSLRGVTLWTGVLLALALFLPAALLPGLGLHIAYGEGTAATQVKVIKRGDAAAGKVIYERHCHYCHGRKGYGDGPIGTAITPHPADFVHDSKRMAKSDEKLFKSISEGKQKDIGGEAMAMPRWAHILSEADIWDVLAYVRELERSGRAAEGLPPNLGTVVENEKKMRKHGKDTK